MSHPADDPRGPDAAQTRARIGLVGLGAMGSRIAGRLLDAGHPVSATNRTAAKARPLIERGLVWLGSPHEVAASTDVVLSMVTDDEALEAITTGPRGLLAGLAAGQVYADMSTVSPCASRRLAARVRALGAHMLDAPVSGSIPQVESGTLAIMVGGEREAFVAVEPLLRELGQTVTHVGANGQGQMKITTTRVTLSPGPLSLLDADGTAIIIHGNPDQGTTGEPKSGVSGGPRVACGVVTKQ